MTRGIVVASIAVAVLLAGAVVPASAVTVEYVLTWTDDQDSTYGIKVKQETDPFPDGSTRYTYTIETDGASPPPGVNQMGFGAYSIATELGFDEGLDGGAIWGVTSGPVGLSWTATGTGGGSPTPTWTADSDADGIPWDEAGDNMRYFSNGPPDRLYDAHVIIKWDSDGDGNRDTTTTVTGQISGPTPEPCTLALLGLGLSGAGMIRLLKRRRE